MLNGKRVLIVDDSATIRKYLANLLTKNGAEAIAEASTGQETIARFESGEPCDLLLLDLMLPDLDGLQVLQKVRQSNDQCAIVMVTGTGGIKTATTAVSQGADGYIDKQALTIGSDPADFYLALEQALERRAGLYAQKELQDFKADFYSMVTHDLRNPAGIIVLSTDMLLRGEAGPLNAEQTEVLAIANNAGRKLLNLINTYLDFAKIDAGYLRLEIGEVELSNLVEASAQLARIQANSKSQTLVLDLPEHPVPALADAERLKQVLDNLISNAIKYSLPGGRITVQLRVNAEASEATFRIIDTGAGIAADQLPNLFAKYHRLPGQSTKAIAGTGLGLLIVKEIVTAHGGAVSAESEGENRGATFVVTLPLKTPRAG
jgi:signal transduction histidine kinase